MRVRELSFVMAHNGTSSVAMLGTVCTKLMEIRYLLSKVTQSEVRTQNTRPSYFPFVMLNSGARHGTSRYRVSTQTKDSHFMATKADLHRFVKQKVELYINVSRTQYCNIQVLTSFAHAVC